MLRRHQNILMIYKIFYHHGKIILILLEFWNIKLTKIQLMLILLCRDILFILTEPKNPTEE